MGEKKKGRKKKCKYWEGFEDDKGGWLKRRKEGERNLKIGNY